VKTYSNLCFSLKKVLARAREFHGGLLSLLEGHQPTFKVSRVPKNDSVSLIITPKHHSHRQSAPQPPPRFETAAELSSANPTITAVTGEIVSTSKVCSFPFPGGGYGGR
jgi:hypothetical protein